MNWRFNLMSSLSFRWYLKETSRIMSRCFAAMSFVMTLFLFLIDFRVSVIKMNFLSFCSAWSFWVRSKFAVKVLDALIIERALIFFRVAFVYREFFIVESFISVDRFSSIVVLVISSNIFVFFTDSSQDCVSCTWVFWDSSSSFETRMRFEESVVVEAVHLKLFDEIKSKLNLNSAQFRSSSKSEKKFDIADVVITKAVELRSFIDVKAEARIENWVSSYCSVIEQLKSNVSLSQILSSVIMILLKFEHRRQIKTWWIQNETEKEMWSTM